jgi:hypothetical protein
MSFPALKTQICCIATCNNLTKDIPSHLINTHQFFNKGQTYPSVISLRQELTTSNSQSLPPTAGVRLLVVGVYEGVRVRRHHQVGVGQMLVRRGLLLLLSLGAPCAGLAVPYQHRDRHSARGGQRCNPCTHVGPVGVVQPLLLLRALRLVPVVLEPDLHLPENKIHV